MDIKLRARLTAYSKVESVQNSSNLPDPELANSGKVLGINNSGKYTLVPSVDQQSINTLFVDQTPKAYVIGKSEIDTLFEKSRKPETVTKDEIDDLFETQDPGNGLIVSYEAIDSLFKR